MRTTALAMSSMLICSAAMTSANAQFDFLQIDNKACALVQSGSMNKDVLWLGSKTAFGLCGVVVPMEDFQKRYSVCALAGVLASEGSAMCEFGFSHNKKTHIFFMSHEKTLCEFVCTKRQ